MHCKNTAFTIFRLNERFYAEMLAHRDDIGRKFLEFTPYFKMYSVYVSNHERASARLAELLQVENGYQ
jgi:hypothetical protein